MPTGQRFTLDDAAKAADWNGGHAVDEATGEIVHGAERAEKPSSCDHSHWTWATHGRVCSCGTFIVDFGD